MARKRSPINPYLAGPPIKGPHGFYGRQDLVKAVVNTLTTSQYNTIVLHGQRRIGKSSLLYRLRRDETLRQAYWPIFFDLQMHKGSSPARILTSLAQTILDELDELNLDITLPTEASLAEDSSQFQQAFLAELHAHLDNKRLLLLCDEFDLVIPPEAADAPQADTILGYLQALTATEQHLAFIFAVGQRLDLLGEGYKHLFSQMRAEPVGRLEKVDTYELLTGLGQQGQMSYTDDALAEIWTLTNGHPYLTQLLGYEVFTSLQQQQNQKATAADVSACLDKAMEHGQGGLDWFWTGFERDQQLVLAAAADLTDPDQGSDDAQLDEILQRHHLFLTPATRRDVYTQLIQGDFLFDSGEKHYQFTVEFIRRWISKYHPLKDVQRQIDQKSPAAQRYYQLGREAHEKGQLPRAIKNYRQALQHNPDFSVCQLALAWALRARGEITEAIEACEKAYQLDPTEAREELIELHLKAIQELEKTPDDEATLVHTRRILAIDPTRLEARRLLSDIYLNRANIHLEHNDLDAALESVQNLVKPLPLTQDADVSQCLRQLWVNYTQKLTRQEPPRWNEAQRALNSLASLDLLDEATSIVYNQLTLDKARAELERGRLDAALRILQEELKHPLPTDEVKALLLDDSRQRVTQQQWPQAEKARRGLYRLIGDAESQTALQDLYHAWGDSLLKDKKFNEAIKVYHREETRPDFQQKIVDVHLNKAEQFLTQDQFVEAKTSYRQAIEILNTDTTRYRARLDLLYYYDNFQAEQKWQQAERTLQILQDLGLAGDDEASQQKIDLQLGQAKTDLEAERLDVAFQRLGTLVDEAGTEIKTLIQIHIQQKARQAEWAAGDVVLDRLDRLLPGDIQTTFWRVNWLFMWAKALFRADKTNQNLIQAKQLCQQIVEIMDIAGVEAPIVDLLDEASGAVEQEGQDLRRQVYTLWADILLAQAQTCLDQSNMEEAQTIFEEALTLSLPPTHLTPEIEAKIQAFSQRQIDQENWEQAQRILEMALRLGISSRQIRQLLTNMTISHTHFLFNENQLETAFSTLNRLQSDLIETEKYQEIKRMGYYFSRLYLGHSRWAAAAQTLKNLHGWVSAQDRAEVASWLNDLNRDWLGLVRGKRLMAQSEPTSPTELEYLVEEVRVSQVGHEDAAAMKLDDLNDWAENFIRASLRLGQVYLVNDDLEAAIQAYHNMLTIVGQDIAPITEVNQQLYSFSECQLEQTNWDRARLALEAFEESERPGPDGQPQPDPRRDGAIQRLLLTQAQALLKEDRFEETFAQLRLLPKPWPRGEIKAVIFAYTQEHRDRQDWHHAIIALHQLDLLLVDDRQQTHDPEVVAWQIDNLEQWGQHLEIQNNLTEAVDIYQQALGLIPSEDYTRRDPLAAHTIRLALQLAQEALDSDDPRIITSPSVVDQALPYYRSILAVPEHNAEHEQNISEAIHRYASKLAEADQWLRAYQMLDALDDLYPTPGNKRRSLFATWRRDLVLKEIRTLLENRQIEATFERLTWLKGWLEQYNAPKVTWLDSAGDVKKVVHHFSQLWLSAKEPNSAMQLLTHLTELLPEDREIKSWRIDALCQWGQLSRRQGLLVEAQTQYGQALAEAPQEDTVLRAQIEQDLLDTRLDQAQQYLEQDDLSAAVTVYKRVLQKRDEYPGFSDKIRTALINHVDTLSQQESPEWDALQQVLASLQALDLQNSQVLKKRKLVALQKMAAMLRQDDLEAAFVSLANLQTPWTVDDIGELVWKYSETHAKGDTWPLAIEVLQHLGSISANNPPVRSWAIKKLMELAQLLETNKNLPGGEAALKAAIDLRGS